MISFFPTSADIGNPFPIAFEKQERSGITFILFWYPPKFHLNPVTTSSNINIILFFVATFLT